MPDQCNTFGMPKLHLPSAAKGSPPNPGPRFHSNGFGVPNVGQALELETCVTRPVQWSPFTKLIPSACRRSDKIAN
jgi:hypothetical protein